MKKDDGLAMIFASLDIMAFSGIFFIIGMYTQDEYIATIGVMSFAISAMAGFFFIHSS